MNRLAVILQNRRISEIVNNLPENSKLKRLAKNGVIKRKFSPQSQIKLSLNDCLHFDRYNDLIEDFIKTLERDFSHCDLTSFYRNIQSLQIDNVDHIACERIKNDLVNEVPAVYYSSTNLINISKNPKYKETLYHHICHELLHMATNQDYQKEGACGFNKYIGNVEIGRGLNEGYTEYLVAKHFSPYAMTSYFGVQKLAAGIEEIVGSKKMSELFFKNDLEGLINEISKYTSRDNAISILTRMDKLVDNLDSPNKKELEDELRKEIAKVKLSKIEKRFATGQLSAKSYIHEVFAARVYMDGFYSIKKLNEEYGYEGEILLELPLSCMPYIDISKEKGIQAINEFFERYQHNTDNFESNEIPSIFKLDNYNRRKDLAFEKDLNNMFKNDKNKSKDTKKGR